MRERNDFMYLNFSEDYLAKILNKLPKRDLDNLIEKRQFSESFLQKYISYFDKDLLSLYQKLSETFIIKNMRYLNMKIISYSQKLSEGFILDYIDKLSIRDLLDFQELSDYTTIKLKKKLFFEED